MNINYILTILLVLLLYKYLFIEEISTFDVNKEEITRKWNTRINFARKIISDLEILIPDSIETKIIEAIDKIDEEYNSIIDNVITKCNQSIQQTIDSCDTSSNCGSNSSRDRSSNNKECNLYLSINIL